MKKIFCAAVLVLFAFTSAAKDYLVTNRSVAVGEKVQYVSRTFTGGDNILSSLQQIPNVAETGDNFYFEPGDYYGNVTIATPKVSLLGANANREDRTATRISESVIRGTITVNASGVLINGFAFTGAGCVTNTSATPSAPIDGFNFAYNKVYGSTVAKERFSAVLRLGVGYTGNDAKNANAHEFIMSLPNGYETDIGQRGIKLSGGQKQRLCIARALLCNPKILILDDSTSAVDTATDAKIRKAFAEAIPNTTKLIIAQRISSIEHADRIIVMNEGHVDGVGTHEELLATNAIYREVYEAQTGGSGDFDEKEKGDEA